MVASVSPTDEKALSARITKAGAALTGTGWHCAGPDEH
jgi:hypothetical protein